MPTKKSQSKMASPHEFGNHGEMSSRRVRTDQPQRTLDDILQLLEDFGRYQRWKLLLLGAFSIMSAWHALNMVFVGAEPRFHCRIDDVNLTLYNISHWEAEALLIPKEESCKRFKPSERLLVTVGQNGNISGGGNLTEVGQEKCPAGYVFSTDEYDSTITSQFELVCGREVMRSTSKSVFFAGRLVGAVSFGQLSDRFGRRPMFFVGVAMLLVAGSVAAAAPSMMIFLPMYFMQGAAHTGAFLVSYTLSTELVGPKYRAVAGFIIQGFYSIGFVTLAGIAYFIRDWRYLELAITAPALLFIFYWWLLPESVRWLLSNGKDEQAKQLLTKAAETNGKTLPPEVLQSLHDDPTLKGDRHYTVLDCLRSWSMARLSLNVWFNWLVNALVYYGLSLNTENLVGSPYLNFCLAGAVEIPAHILCVIVLNRLGRRWLLISMMYLGGIACIVSGFIPQSSTMLKNLAVALAMIGKFGSTASYGIIHLTTVEIFPTVVRSIGMGMSSMSARIGGILAPFIVETSSVMPELPMLIFGGLSILAATLAFLLPETAGRPLPQLLEHTNTGKNCAPCVGRKNKDRNLDAKKNDVPLEIYAVSRDAKM